MPKKKLQKIYVTGAGGYIGGSVYDKLEWNERYDVVPIKNSTEEFDLHKGDIVVHMGAYSSTTGPWDVYYNLNLMYTLKLMDKCKKVGAKLIYASSAAVYGNDGTPLNDYARSKLALDNYNQELDTPFVGLRFFNVYGGSEGKKGKDASMIQQWNEQLSYNDKAKIFNKKALRDFVYIDDVVDVILYFVENYKPGIYDVGTGRPESFETVLDEMIKIKGKGEKEWIKFPKHLKGKYQTYTCADLTKLREAGYTKEFLSIYEGLRLNNYRW